MKLLHYKGELVDEKLLHDFNNAIHEPADADLNQRSIIREKNIIRAILEEPSFVEENFEDDANPDDSGILKKDKTIILDRIKNEEESFDFTKPSSNPNKTRYITMPTSDSEDETPR